jgi:membrane fusion protein (multidrug efflux system)
MSTAFARTAQTLAADRSRGWLWSLFLAVALLGAWGLWFGLAHVPVYALADAARLEVGDAVHPLEAPLDGRVVVTHLSLGRKVAAGDILVELDTAPQQLQLAEAEPADTGQEV